jgi:hypothetical protein
LSAGEPASEKIISKLGGYESQNVLSDSSLKSPTNSTHFQRPLKELANAIFRVTGWLAAWQPPQKIQTRKEVQHTSLEIRNSSF